METLYLPKVDSTQTHLKEVLLSFDSPKPLSIYSFHQFNGYGQSNHTWDCPANQGLALSIAWPIPRETTVDWIIANKLISTSITQFIRNTTLLPAILKWPNDLILNHKKFGGIIMQTYSASKNNYLIVGIGLNFETTIESNKRTSLQEEGFTVTNKHDFTQQFIDFLHHQWNNPWSIDIPMKYHQLLWKNQEWVNIEFISHQMDIQQSEILNCQFLGVDEMGRAIINKMGEIVHLHHGEARICL